jgi:hypothetical protein
MKTTKKATAASQPGASQPKEKPGAKCRALEVGQRNCKCGGRYCGIPGRK